MSKKLRRRFVARLILGGLLCAAGARAQAFVTAEPHRGEGIYGLLRRHLLPTNADYIDKFRELNADRLTVGDALRCGAAYLLPIIMFQYDGIGIGSSVGIEDEGVTERIREYNRSVREAGLLPSGDMETGVLWVPFFYLHGKTVSAAQKVSPQPSGVLIGNNQALYKKPPLPQISRRLEGRIFYLVSGHGGPDPGAVAMRNGVKLYEDEYAYDIVLRLGWALEQHGAEVYFIVQDPDDGIRDDPILRGDHDERYIGGAPIDRRTIPRLQKRIDLINELFALNRRRARSQHAVFLHVDSRSTSQRVDVFYYYQQHSAESRRLALTLHRAFKNKYDRHQPGRGYRGTVSTRNLYVLKRTVPPAVYIEAANIRNPRDQDRLVIVNNRQAVANWLCEGIIEHLKH